MKYGLVGFFDHRSASQLPPGPPIHSSHHTHVPQFQGVARKGYTLRGLQGDSLSLLDRSVGRLMDLFVQLGIDNDTLFIFSAGQSIDGRACEGRWKCVASHAHSRCHSAADNGGARYWGPDTGGVNGEAGYVVGEYQIVILSAGQSGALFTWLTDNGYAVPATAQDLLGEYIEAGSDFFLMPSRYEPCGLNQMYSLRYGTPPIVHRTGGLADTVSPFDARRERGTGFVFNHFDEGGLRYGLGAALSACGQGRPEDRARMATLQRNGMRQRFGWDERIGSYEAIYKMLVP